MKSRTIGMIAALPAMAGGIIWLSLENADLRARLAASSAQIQIERSAPKTMVEASAPGSRAASLTKDGQTAEPITQPLKGLDSIAHELPLGQIMASTPDGQIVIQDPRGGPRYIVKAEEIGNLLMEHKVAQAKASSKRPNGPSWSPGQAAGPPNTETHGDFSTAWASQSQDGGAEWLKVKYPNAVEISEINIHESYNPGAISKVGVILPDGGQKVIWEGVASPETGLIERGIKLPPGIRSDQVLIELDTARVPGWNEIDAVEIVGRDGSRQWGAESTASSYFGEGHTGQSLSFDSLIREDLPTGPPSP